MGILGSTFLPAITGHTVTQQASDFWKFSSADELAKWPLKYERVEPYPLAEHSDELVLNPETHYAVRKMTFGRKNKQIDKTTIQYNSHVSLSGIPAKAYEYVVNGKPAIEWIIERYQLTRDRDSGISNDPNDWAKEDGKPRYKIDLLKRVVRVSVESLKIIESLPRLNERI